MLQMNQLCEPELKKIVRLYFEVGRLPKNLKQHRPMFVHLFSKYGILSVKN
jgi:hypothetical protein